MLSLHFWKLESPQLATGVGVSLLLHALLIASQQLRPSVALGPARSSDALTQVTYFERSDAPAAAPPAPVAEPSAAPPVAAPRRVTRSVAPRALVVARPTPEPAASAEATGDDAPAPAPAESLAAASSATSPAAGTVGAGAPGGTGAGAGGGALQVLPFGPGMTRPVQISGKQPEYTPRAIAARVAGKVLTRCVITAAGTVEDCQVLKGVPWLTEVVLDSLRHSRFQPVTYQGRPQSIRYLFTYNFELP